MPFQWSNALSIGIPEIDNQHYELVSRINSLLNAMMNGEGTVEITRLFDFLDEYVVVHFREEEQFMLSIKYPDRERHSSIHKAFTEDLIRLKNECSNSDLAYPILQVQRRVCDWIINHIGKVDQKLNEFHQLHREQ